MATGLADVLNDVHFVQATYPYIGQDEDELSFNKGDIIVICKVDDGGWWEGTRDGKIGWFPNGYVTDVAPGPENADQENVVPEPISEVHKANHNFVVGTIIDTEDAHMTELKVFFDKYLEPLENSDVLSPSDLSTLCGNYEEIVAFHKKLLKNLKKQLQEDLELQKIGAEFLKILHEMKDLYLSYCANHPWAASILSRENEKLGAFMETAGAPNPGIMTLTTMLSKPFVHIEKYANQLKELERHIEEQNFDFLDIKKAAQAFQIVALSCNETRKRKEMELEMLTGTIEGWEGEPITALGNIILMTQVFVEKEDVERKERYFCLFPEELVVLFVSVQLVGYCFEERHKLANIFAKNLEDTEEFFNAFQIRAKEETAARVMMTTPHEKDAWMASLTRLLGDRCKCEIQREVKPVALERTESSKRREIQSMPRWGNEPSEPILRSYSTGSTGPVQRPSLRKATTEFSPLPDESHEALKRGYTGLNDVAKEPPVAQNWSFTRLRPTPPWQPNFNRLKAGDDFVTSPRTMRRLVSSKRINKARSKSEDDTIDAYTPSGRRDTSARRDTAPSKRDAVLRRDMSNASQISGASDSPSILEEDMMILSVIEAYCFSAKQRHTMNCLSPSSLLPPEVPPHFSFKPVTPTRAHYPGKHKKSRKKKPEIDISTEVLSLKSQVQNLQKQTLYLRENLEEEREQRRQFEKLLRRTLRNLAPELDVNRESIVSMRSSIGGM